MTREQVGMRVCHESVHAVLRTVLQVLVAMELWLVGAAVAASMLAPQLLPWAVGGAVGFWGLRYIARGVVTVCTPADGAIGLMVLILPVSLWVSPLPSVTRAAILSVLSGITLYYAIVNWGISTVRVHHLITGLVVLGLFLALIAPVTVEWSTGSKYLFQWHTLYSSFPALAPDLIHPNILAGPLVLLFPFAVALLAFSWSQLAWHQRCLAGGTVVAIQSVVLLTQSRGGVLGLAASLAVCLTLRWRWSWPLLMVALLIGISAFYVSGSDTSVLRGLSYRLTMWSGVFAMLSEVPWTGIGIGTYETTSVLLYPSSVKLGQEPHTHNLFLQVAIDLGIPGLMAWLSLVLLVLRAGWRLYRFGHTVRNDRITSLGVGVLGSQTALMIHGLVDAVSWGVELAVITWATWGVAMSGWNLMKTQSLVEKDAAHRA